MCHSALLFLEENRTENFQNLVEYYDYEIDIRIECLKSHLDTIVENIHKNIEKTSLNCKNSLTRYQGHELCVDDILHWEYYACLKKLNIKSIKPTINNVGILKSLPSGIPGIRK